MELERLRQSIYRTFAETGRPPQPDQLVRTLGLNSSTLRNGLRQLALTRHLVIDERDEIVMAHPFSAVPTAFSVMSGSTLWWGGCAWDAFALPHLVRGASPALVATTCPACDRPHAWTVTREAPPAGDQVAHFLVPTTRMWDDVRHTCAHQRLFCSTDCVDSWLAATGRDRGYVLNLPTLWRLASHWYEGRLHSPYVRREPAAAAGYLRSVGLTGSFWGL
ncbi:organomercurial lyase [Kitasatospora sp. NPDC088351]|uniref:organomercurial lyase n=1 Tax=unclassified Kitasatospora TaxID=2633591 RepID=UPI003417A7CB